MDVEKSPRDGKKMGKAHAQRETITKTCQKNHE
jgi:hypothetical protein